MSKLAQAFQQRWRFGIVEGKIAMLTIMPEPLPALPAPVAAYINSTNACDLAALLSTFADDALVNDSHSRSISRRAGTKLFSSSSSVITQAFES
jgi:hypothetical protein